MKLFHWVGPGTSQGKTAEGFSSTGVPGCGGSLVLAVYSDPLKPADPETPKHLKRKRAIDGLAELPADGLPLLVICTVTDFLSRLSEGPGDRIDIKNISGAASWIRGYSNPKATAADSNPDTSSNYQLWLQRNILPKFRKLLLLHLALESQRGTFDLKNSHGHNNSSYRSSINKLLATCSLPTITDYDIKAISQFPLTSVSGELRILFKKLEQSLLEGPPCYRPRNSHENWGTWCRDNVKTLYGNFGICLSAFRLRHANLQKTRGPFYLV